LIPVTLTQRLKSFFTSSQELRQITGKVQQLRIIQLHYEKVAPPSLLRSSQVLHIEQGELILAASNSAVAAKLRQMAPELTTQLQLNGCEVTGIQVRVQVTTPPSIRTPTPVSMSTQGKQYLTDLADSLNDSPLKSALKRLAQNSKKNL